MKQPHFSEPPDQIDQKNMTPDAKVALEANRVSRRNFLKSAGMLVVGFNVVGFPLKTAEAAAACSPDGSQVAGEACLRTPRCNFISSGPIVFTIICGINRT